MKNAGRTDGRRRAGAAYLGEHLRPGRAYGPRVVRQRRGISVSPCLVHVHADLSRPAVKSDRARVNNGGGTGGLRGPVSTGDTIRYEYDTKHLKCAQKLTVKSK